MLLGHDGRGLGQPSLGPSSRLALRLGVGGPTTNLAGVAGGSGIPLKMHH